MFLSVFRLFRFVKVEGFFYIQILRVQHKSWENIKRRNIKLAPSIKFFFDFCPFHSLSIHSSSFLFHQFIYVYSAYTVSGWKGFKNFFEKSKFFME